MERPEILPASGMGMREFVEANGWSYVGECGCLNNYRYFSNPLFPDRQIWIIESQPRMEIKQLFQFERGNKTLALAGKVNFEHIYKMFFA